MIDIDSYEAALLALTPDELFMEETRAMNMLRFDMDHRVGEPRCGLRPWHHAACESAERLLTVRRVMEMQDIPYTPFGYEVEVSAYAVAA